jgi:hypothetical protein
VTAVEQLAIELADAAADPGFRAVEGRRRAARDHAVEILIDPHREHVGAHRAGEALAHMETVEGDDPALAGLDPEQGRVVGILRHGKDAGGIGLEQDLSRDVERTAVHGANLGLFGGRGESGPQLIRC